MKISVEANRPYRSVQRRGRPLEKGWAANSPGCTVSLPESRDGQHFTLIELLIVIAIIAILLTSESIFFMSVYVNGVLGKV